VTCSSNLLPFCPIPPQLSLPGAPAPDILKHKTESCWSDTLIVDRTSEGHQPLWFFSQSGREGRRTSLCLTINVQLTLP
jgi:hypothetical protein